MSRYKIFILTLQGKTLIFHVSKYKITEGNFIEFIDEVTGKPKKFHTSRCEIEVIKKGDKNA